MTQDLYISQYLETPLSLSLPLIHVIIYRCLMNHVHTIDNSILIVFVGSHQPNIESIDAFFLDDWPKMYEW